ncbi:transglutaminase domain-containing protein [Flavobacterium sp. UBA7680]|uniref:transglutaminase domain-containing protein n=1 Tax=Flavobacterium sp. UBA7680 TaxID=1946559 RepID=UPI0025C0D028|nr:transglutaminase domain-containing protein [Flavobacterium sp. UBA7680]
MAIKKRFFVFFFWSITLINSAYSQKYNAIDSIVLKYPNFGSVEKLAERIQKDFASERDKARAIYSWVTLNINYDAKKFFSPSDTKTFSSKDGSQIDKQMEYYRDNQIKKTFRSKKGVCEDFSNLYEQIGALCGLKVKVISGDAKVDLNDIGRKRLYSNHAWNMVEIDGKWTLVDVTWGEGYLDYKTKTAVKEFTPIYFDMDPKYFYAKHFPESENKDFKIDEKSYLNGALIYDEMIEKKCEIFLPQSGIITANEGDKILFKIKNLSEFNDLHCFNNDDENLEMLNLKEQENILEFEILCKKKMGQFITLYRSQNALASFKIIIK